MNDLTTAPDIQQPMSQLTQPPFLRNVWYAAMWSWTVSPGAIQARTIIEEPIAFFRRDDGAIAAIADRCAHRLAPLSMGHLLPGGRVQCAYHGLEFGPDGHCVANPHGPIATSLRVKSYPVAERHGMIWVWMGSRKADPALIPDYSCFDGLPPLHVSKRDYIRMQADYELVTDNLLDLSHTAYLHNGILGHEGMAVADITVEQDGDIILVSRFNAATAIPGMFKDFLPTGETIVDKWNTVRWSAPGCMLINTGVCRPGEDRSRGTGFNGAHIVTPETRRSTHYHFAAARWNVLTQGYPLNARINDDISRLRRFAIEAQDAPVIEGQQRMMDMPGAPDPVMLKVDAGPMRYRRVLKRLKEADRDEDASPAR